MPVLDSPPTVAASAPCWYAQAGLFSKKGLPHAVEHAALLVPAAVEAVEADGTLGGVVALDAGDGKVEAADETEPRVPPLQATVEGGVVVDAPESLLAERPRLVSFPKVLGGAAGDETSRYFASISIAYPALLREAPRSMASTRAHASRSHFSGSK